MSSKTCKHDQLSIQAQTTRIGMVSLDAPDHWTLQAKVACGLCGMPFEFVGLPRVGQPDPEMAAIDPTGLIVQLPVRPGFTQIFGGLNVGLPPKALK